MIIRFDALNRFEHPLFHLCNPGTKYENGALTRSIGILSDTSDEEFEFNFNATSVLSFRAYRREYDDAEQNEHFHHMFDRLQNKMLIYVDEIGFFLITNVTKGYDNETVFKDIEAESCEAELRDKKLPYIGDGTYKFDEILDDVVGTTPMWEVFHVDDTVSERYRTFEDVDTDQNVLSFLLEDMQDAYECIFLFDPINRRINVYDQNTYIKSTNIHLSRDSIINSVEVSDSADDMYTAISVFGDGDLSISAVNPLGTTTMYNFAYYLEWMSPSLRDKVVEWQRLVNYYSNTDGTTPDEDNYPDLGKRYAEAYTDFLNSDAQIDMLNTQLSMYQRCYDNISVAAGNSLVHGYNEVIQASGGTPVPEDIEEVAVLQDVVKQMILDTQSAIAEEKENRDQLDERASAIWDQMLAISQKISISKYFTPDEYEELSCYISEGSYTDEYVTITENMTYIDQFDQLTTLYRRALSQLEKISKPTEEFSVDTENFIFQKNFEEFTEQLETGCIIDVDLDDGDVAPLFLATITVNFDDADLSLTFGNRFCRFDPKAMFQDVLGDVKKSANTIEYMKELLHPIKAGAIDQLSAYIHDSRDLTKALSLAAANQSVVIDDTGYTGKKVLGDYDFDPRQVKITNNNIMFTKDAWDTCDVAIGELTFQDENGDTFTTMGVNAHALIGDIIIGSEMHIMYNDPETGELGDLVFGPGGLNSKVGSGDIISAINQSPEEVKIQANKITLEGLVTVNEKFKVLDDGSVVAKDAQFSGTLTGSTINGGTIGIGGSGGVNSNFYVDSGGNVTMKGNITLSGNITWPTTGVPISRGDIYNAMLKNIQGDGLYSLDGNLCINASAIKTGVLDAEHISIAGTYGGIVQGKGMAAGGTSTDGMKLYSPNGVNGYPYIFISGSGVRIQVGVEEYVYFSGGTMGVFGETLSAHDAIIAYDAYHIKTNNPQYDGEFNVASLDSGASFITFGSSVIKTYIVGTSITSSKPINTESDRRLKKSIEALTDDYAGILDSITPVRFRYKREDDDAPYHLGYCAQDVIAAIETAGLSSDDFALIGETTTEDGESRYSIAYDELISLLHLKVNALSKEIEGLKQKVYGG